jgi:hypothetical protein
MPDSRTVMPPGHLRKDDGQGHDQHHRDGGAEDRVHAERQDHAVDQRLGGYERAQGDTGPQHCPAERTPARPGRLRLLGGLLRHRRGHRRAALADAGRDSALRLRTALTARTTMTATSSHGSTLCPVAVPAFATPVVGWFQAQCHFCCHVPVLQFATAAAR